MNSFANDTIGAPAPLNLPLLFGGLWALLFALYFPAAQAGFVADFTGWLDQVQHYSFSEYINRTHFKVVSLYQFTQLVTWVCYKLFGINAWLWHLLFITLHAVNGCLLAVLCGGMMQAAGIHNYRTICYTGAALCCITPYISEVIVWEPSFHYLLGLLLLLVVMVCVQRYILSAQRKYVIGACIAYVLSTHSIEVFYLTPWLVLSLALFYRSETAQGREQFRKVMLFCVLPLLAVFALRMVEFRMLYGGWVSRIGSQTVLSAQETGLGKPAKYLFHLLFLGRFLPFEAVKEKVYTFCDSTLGITLFYLLFIGDIIWSLAVYKRMGARQRVAIVLAIWVLLALLLVSPLWFGNLLLVIYDRYTYFACAFLFMVVAIGVWSIPNKYLRLSVLTIIVLANLRFAVQASRYWGKAASVTNSLLRNLPAHDGKTIVLLNVPESMHGVPMIGAWQQSEYKLMHDLLVPGNAINDTVREALSYNMVTPDDGAHVQMLNDSTLRVTLNQWGTWWWYEGQGGRSYDNVDYKLNMIDGGHFYEMTLRHPASQYLLLYQVGGQWKTVDVSKTYEQY